ncbi:MAG: DUF5615 family PIN-like protein, partial [Pseudonocardiaceae bacterium]
PARRPGVRGARRWPPPNSPARGRVKFLVDAQLPARLARFLADAGHDTLHTTDLPDGNRTTDAQIGRVQRSVMSVAPPWFISRSAW